jgi:hypothetical protein
MDELISFRMRRSTFNLQPATPHEQKYKLLYFEIRYTLVMSEADAADIRVIDEPYHPLYIPFKMRPVLVKQ